MSPADIVSRIHPNERTRLLIALVAIDKLDADVEGEERDLVQLARYTDLRDAIVAKANASVEREQAQIAQVKDAVEAAVAESAQVFERLRVVGSGEVRTFRGMDKDAVQARAEAALARIDRFRSPSLSTLAKDAAGYHVVEVRSHGLD